MATLVDTGVRLAAQLGGLAVLAGVFAGVLAAAYRWYVRESVPPVLALLVGLSGVAVYLNTTTALGQVIGGGAPAPTEVALFNIAAFAGGAVGAATGRGIGDRVAAGAVGTVDDELSRLVRTVGRAITVDLPEEIEDMVGYDPVPAATKETLAGKRFVFPRRLTVAELRERLVERLTADYAVGHVDLELDEEGRVTYLAVGARAAGIGPTLPPATTAVAVRADPAFAASAGDIVQVWEPGGAGRVLTGELRGINGDVATLAIDAADTSKVDPATRYRLVTLPVKDRPDREFASLLRAARETFSSATVAAGSPLHGLPVGALVPTVIAVDPGDGAAVPIPDRRYVLAAGDTVFAIAPPDALRRLEAAARPLDPAVVDCAPPDAGADGDRDGSGSDPAEPAVGDGGHREGKT
jgi:hypothetical protein